MAGITREMALKLKLLLLKPHKYRFNVMAILIK